MNDFGLKWARWGLLAFSLLAMSLFSILFASSFAERAVIEKAAIFAIQKKIQNEVKVNHPILEAEGFLQSAEVLRDKFEKRGDAIQKALDMEMDKVVAKAIAGYCGCKTVSPERQASITNLFKNRNTKAVAISEKLETFIKGKYDSTVTELIQDLRIFSGVNIFAFALVFLLALIRPAARFHLLLPAGLLLISALLTINLYIFGQNWFYTLMMGNFWGYSYLAYMGIVFAFVLDIALNRGRITSGILNSIASIPLVPC